MTCYALIVDDELMFFPVMTDESTAIRQLKREAGDAEGTTRLVELRASDAGWSYRNVAAVGIAAGHAIWLGGRFCDKSDDCFQRLV